MDTVILYLCRRTVILNFFSLNKVCNVKKNSYLRGTKSWTARHIYNDYDTTGIVTLLGHEVTVLTKFH